MTNEIPTIQEVIIDMLKQGIEKIDKARAKLREATYYKRYSYSTI
jgi:hypothetical protein